MQVCAAYSCLDMASGKAWPSTRVQKTSAQLSYLEDALSTAFGDYLDPSDSWRHGDVDDS
eukprot:5242457-Amphidinium_carterae.2